MKPSVWLPVAILGLLGGVGAAYVVQMKTTEQRQAAATDAAAAAQGSESGQSPAGQGLTEVDRTLPEFELLALDQTPWNTASLDGKPWVINFWASWCVPCIEEIPAMNAAYEFLQPKGVGMLAINAGEGAVAVETFLQKIPINFPNVLGDTNTLVDWSVRVLPTTIVLNSDGKIVYEAIGPREWDDEQLLQRVVDLL